MEQQRAINALEPFIALSKSATSPRAAADLVTQATSHPHTYVFAELLQTPNIQALRNSPEYSPHLRLLEIFAWGTHAEYLSTPNLPPLNDQQSRKLSLLSLLPLCTSPKTLTYTALLTKLALPSTLALESLITTAVYEGLLQAHLDPQRRVVSVLSIAPLRDLAPGSAIGLAEALGAWEARCDDALADIEARIADIKERAAVDGQRTRRRQTTFEAELAKEDTGDGSRGKAGKRGLNSLGGGTGEDVMDIDDGDDGRGLRSSKRSGRAVPSSFFSR